MGFERHVEHHRRWRQGMVERLRNVHVLLGEHGLLQPALSERLDRLLLTLEKDRVRVAVVGERSRGKSELVNALLFGQADRRVVPSGLEGATLCPLEIEASPDGVSRLRLLPVETRQSPWSLARWRESEQHWHAVDMGPADTVSLSEALRQVGQSQSVSVDHAQVLGFLEVGSMSPGAALASPQVDIPRWRHARLMLDHPLLSKGVVVLDTPDLNAVGLEPELAVDWLSQAQAVLFVLAADAGVTRGDRGIWERHLQALAKSECKVWVVLNKIDAVRDGVASPDVWAADMDRQCDEVAQTLGVPRERVLAVSAREAWQAQAHHDPVALQRSRWADLLQALGQDWVERKRSVLMRQLRHDLVGLFQDALQEVHAQQRERIDHTLELQALEGKNTRLLQQMRVRLAHEQSVLDACLAGAQSARDQQQGLLRDFFVSLGPVRLRTVTNDLVAALADPGLGWQLKSLYQNAFGRLRGDIEMASRELVDMHARLQAQARALNVEQGLSLVLIDPPDLRPFVQQLNQIQAGYAQYLGWSTAVQRLKSGFGVRVGQTLLGRLQSMFDTLLNDIEQWHRANQDQMEAQLRARRHHCAKRQEALAKIQQAAGELQRRLADLQEQQRVLDRLNDSLLHLQRQCLPSVSAAPSSELVHGE